MMPPMKTFSAAFGLALAPFALALFALGCESGQVRGSSAAGVEAAPPASPAAAPAHYGAPFEPGPEVKEVTLSALLANPRTYADQTVVTEGKVERACSRKGCWMEISDGSGACRVTFKDYAFFVPRNSAGAYARLQGRVETREVEPAAIEHLESEGARFANKRADGTATEVRLVASAVELRR